MRNNIIDFLKSEINENKISHAFLVETNNCQETLNRIINLFIRNKLIEDKAIDNNMNIRIVEPENNLIDKNKILDLQSFATTTSINGLLKIYFIIDAELMNLSSSNKLLKVLEEPSENVIGFLITKNENQLLSTIRSRCKIFVDYLDNEINTETNQELSKQLLSIKTLNYENLIILKKNIIKLDKIEILQLIEVCKKQINSNLVSVENLSTLANYYKILDNIEELIKSNVNIELCIDKLLIEMRK